MSMTLHFHPLSSFCWKALVGLYELEIPFEKHLVDLSNDAARADVRAPVADRQVPCPARRRTGSHRPRIDDHPRVHRSLESAAARA